MIPNNTGGLIHHATYANSDAGAGWPFGAVLVGSMQASGSTLGPLALLLDATQTGVDPLSYLTDL